MNDQPDQNDLELIPTDEAARLLGISAPTLQMRRTHGLPPRYYKFGELGSHAHVRYDRNDVMEYLTRSLREPGNTVRDNRRPEPSAPLTGRTPSQRKGRQRGNRGIAEE